MKIIVATLAVLCIVAWPNESGGKSQAVPRYPMGVVAPVFSQFRQETPLNYMDIPRDELPQTREAMKELIDRNSRWLSADE